MLVNIYFLLFQSMSAQLDLKQMTTLFGQAVSGEDIVLESYCAGYRELSKYAYFLLSVTLLKVF